MLRPQQKGKDMTLEEYAYMGEIIAAIAVVASLIYLGVQVSQSKISAEREAAFEMIRSFQTVEFARMLQISLDVPKGLTRDELESWFEDENSLLFAYFATWESLGIMVYRGQISLELVCDFFSHPILLAWEMAETSVLETRKKAGRDTPWEWFQWLTERVRMVESKQKPLPAYIEYDDWRPQKLRY